MQEIRIDPHTTPPKPVRRRWQCHFLLGRAFTLDFFFFVGEIGVAGEVDLDRADWVEALRTSHGGYVWARGVFGGWVEDEHAEADEGVAEEDCSAEDDHYEEDVDFLTEVIAREC
jgi:hypothetical protein